MTTCKAGGFLRESKWAPRNKMMKRTNIQEKLSRAKEKSADKKKSLEKGFAILGKTW